MGERSAPLRSILHAAAQVLSCDSAHLARLSEDRQFLALAVAVTARAVPEFEAVETALGGQISGLQVPAWVTESVLWRAIREERLIVTHDVTEIAGGALPSEIVQQIGEIIGPRTFAVAPILGRSGALGVMFVEKVGQVSLSAEERGLLLMYAERVGSELESEALSDEASRLQQLGQVAPPPPTLWTCVPAPGELGLGLLCRGGMREGQPLHTVLGIAEPGAIWSPDIQRRLAVGETVTLSATAQNGPPVPAPSAATPTPGATPPAIRPRPPDRLAAVLGRPGRQPSAPESTGRSLRLTLRAGPAPFVLCAVEDLTWSERLRRETLLAQEHLTKVMHSVGDAILTVDEAGIIQNANEATSVVLGLSPAQLCGRPAQALAATSRGREQLAALRQRLLKTGFAERHLRLCRGEPGGASQQQSGGSKAPAKSFPAHLSALLLGDENGRPAGAVWRIHDQTERQRGDAEGRRLRLRLLQSERLSALGEMAARIAHEVRNPLVSIGAAAQVVAEELPPDSPVRGEALAIGSEVRRLDGIVTDFLRFARPRRREAGVAAVDRALREVIELVRPKAGGLRLDLHVPGPDGGVHALIDPDGLKQILWNVLLNACEAALSGAGLPAASRGAPSSEPPGRAGAIECEVRLRPAQAGGPEARVLVTIADSGPGVPESVRRRVFDPFFSTKARGTGLGLSICKQIVDESGGRIRLLNRPGGGTRVVIELLPAPPSLLLETVS